MDKSESAMEGVDEDAHKQWCLTSFSVIFKKEDLSKEVDLKQVWKEEVEAVFQQHGVSCKLNWGEGLMIVSGTERTTDPEIISRGVRALYVLACGLGTEYVEPIVSGEIHCDYIPITIPDGMSEDDFSSKYTDFRNKFERKFFLTDNTDFTVVGVIGPPGVGKSTIMNELYGFDATSPGMLPPFAIETEEGKAMARHCSVGIEPRVSSERLILLDTQPVFSPSVLAEMIRPDGSSTIPVLNAEALSAELAHEIMGIQLGVLLTSICHIFLVISEGVHDHNMWHLISTVDLLKHGIPDPSSHTLSHSQSSNVGPEKDGKEKAPEGGEYMALPVFVHTKLRDHDLSPHSLLRLKKALQQYTSTSSFTKAKNANVSREHPVTSMAPSTQSKDPDSLVPKLYVIPMKSKDDSNGEQYESYTSMLSKLRDQVLSMNPPSFRKTD